MHDIGKVGISDAILLKPGALTGAEREVVNTHTTIGYEILRDSPSKYLQLGAVIALRHHEHYDGNGYPDGLKGEAIPIEARIVAVADVYDALVSERPYKQAWPMQAAVDYLNDKKGKQFDPQCVQAFLGQLDQVSRIHQKLKGQKDVNSC
jgi:two-component system response regulator RpfG